MKKGYRSAFTMIELIFVIIILGILAVTALPKFVGVQDDAKIAAEKGVIGAVRGGISLSHSKWLLRQENVDWDGDGTVEQYSTTGYLHNLEDGGAHSNQDASNNIFAEILNEPVDEWTRSEHNTSAYNFEGPATKDTGGVPDSGTNDINTSGAWVYDDTTGRIFYQ